MKISIRNLFSLGLIGLSLSLCTLDAIAQVPEKTITLEDIWLKYQYVPKYPSGFNWMKDDNFYTQLEDNKIEKYGIKDQAKTATILDIATLEDPTTGEVLKISDYRFSDDESKILLAGNSEAIYRHSTKETCHVLDTKSKKVFRLHDGKPISFATFSPDGNAIAYMSENNLFAYDFTINKESTLSTDGKWGSIINGGTDWVYEEEFAFDKAFAWSPDSKKIAFYRFDESKVREFSMAIYGELYPKEYKFKYPKAGEDNAQVSIYFYEVASGVKTAADLGSEPPYYIPRITWTQSSSELAVMAMNRAQNKLEVLLVDANSGGSKIILTESEEAYVEQPSDLKWYFLKNGKEFLWQSESDGHMHIYLYDLAGKLIRQITKGDFDVAEFCGVDEKRGNLYYISSVDGPTEQQLYMVALDGKKPQKLTKEPGFHGASFSSNFSYYLDSYSTMGVPPYSALYDHTGKEVKKLEDNAALKSKLEKLDIAKPAFFSFKNSVGTELNGWMMKPANFDKKNKYPVLMTVYGGPGSQTVKNEYGGFNYVWHQMLAQQGYIVVSVDNRGTGARGEEFKKCTYGKLGKLEAEDQIDAAKYLGTLDYINKDRIGIWGWSYGGYMTSLCLVKGEGVFKMGIAVAPVTNWRFYDTIYTASSRGDKNCARSALG